MKRGLFIVLFVVLILFISGQQSCEPTFSIGEPVTNTCCMLSRIYPAYGVSNCINDISQNKCDTLYSTNRTYYTRELYETNLANSCVDICSTEFLSCNYQDNIYENGELLCHVENEEANTGTKIYLCNNGVWTIYSECASCTNTNPCMNPDITTGFCSDGTGESCAPICTPVCQYASDCAETGTDMSGCNLNSACSRRINGNLCWDGTGRCLDGWCCGTPDFRLLMHFGFLDVDDPMLDSSSYHNNGISNTGATAVNSELYGFGKAMKFDGIDDHIVIADSTSLRPDKAITISALIKIPTINHGSAGIVEKFRRTAGETEEIGYALLMDNTGKKLTFFVRGTTSYANTVTGTTNLVDNKWHYVVATMDLKGMKVYVDGKLDAVRVVNLGTNIVYPVDAQKLYIGLDSNSNYRHFNGQIDEVTIYDRVLSDVEISHYYERGRPYCLL